MPPLHTVGILSLNAGAAKNSSKLLVTLHVVGENGLDLVVSVTGGQHMKTLTQFRTATLIGLLLLTNEAMAQKSIPTTHTIFMTSV